MTDLGADSANTIVNASFRAFELLQHIADRLIQDTMRLPEMRRARYELKLAKTRAEQMKIAERINNKTGLINMKEMRQTGRELVPVPLAMDRNQLSRFREHMDHWGLKFAATESIKGNHFDAWVFREDIPQLEYVIDRMKNEAVIKDMRKQIRTIMKEAGSIKNLTAEQKKEIYAIHKEIMKITTGDIADFNSRSKEFVIKKTADQGKKEIKSVTSLDEALNRYQGYEMENDLFIASAEDPSAFIKVHSFGDKYECSKNGRMQKMPYTRSTYEVNKGGKVIETFDDRRYTGRPAGSWNQMKEKMIKLLGRPKTMFEFNSENEYREWAEEAQRQNEDELTDITPQKLNDELSHKGYKYQNGHVYTNYDLRLKDGTVWKAGMKVSADLISTARLTTEQKLNLTEAHMIGRQLNLYAQIENLREEEKICSACYRDADTDEARQKLKKEMKEIHSEISARETELKNCIESRKMLNGSQVQDIQDQTRQQEETVSQEQDELLSMDEIQQKLDEYKASEDRQSSDMKDSLINHGKEAEKLETESVIGNER